MEGVELCVELLERNSKTDADHKGLKTNAMQKRDYSTAHME